MSAKLIWHLFKKSSLLLQLILPIKLV